MVARLPALLSLVIAFLAIAGASPARVPASTDALFGLDSASIVDIDDPDDGIAPAAQHPASPDSELQNFDTARPVAFAPDPRPSGGLAGANGVGPAHGVERRLFRPPRSVRS